MYCGNTVETKALAKMLNSTKEFIVFDCETTGLDAEKEHIIQLCAKKISTKTLKEVDKKEWYINPNIPLPLQIIEITGITDDDLEDKPTFKEVFREIKDFFSNNFVVGQNVTFDIRFMETEFRRLGEKFSPIGYFDTLALAREKLRKGYDIKNHKLETLVKYYYPNKTFNFHNASADVEATFLVMLAQMKYLKEGTPEVEDAPAKIVKIINTWEYLHFVMFRTQKGENLYYNRKTGRFGCKNKKLEKQIDWEKVKSQAEEILGLNSIHQLRRNY